jgi:hypothetical protein
MRWIHLLHYSNVAVNMDLRQLLKLRKVWCLGCATACLSRGAKLDEFGADGEPIVFTVIELALQPEAGSKCANSHQNSVTFIDELCEKKMFS